MLPQTQLCLRQNILRYGSIKDLHGTHTSRKQPTITRPSLAGAEGFAEGIEASAPK